MVESCVSWRSCCGIDCVSWLNATVLHPTHSQAIGARCLDGSPSGFYYSLNPKSTVWVIYLHGGGFCWTKKDCQERAKGSEGSSKHWGLWSHGDGIISQDQKDNPEFYNANIIEVPYCGGDLHSGTRKTQDWTSYGLYFSGHLTIEAVFAHLLNTTALSNASSVILTGTSAGGLGAILHADYVGDLLTPHGAQIVVVPNAGWFISVKEYDPLVPPIDELLAVPWALYHGWLPPSCTAKHPTNKWVCYLAHFHYPTIKTPMYVAESQYDTQQLYKEDTLAKGNTSKTRAYVTYWGGVMRGQLKTLKPTDGYFNPSCFVHGVDFNSIRINGTNFQQGLSAWLAQLRSGAPASSNSTRLMDACGPLPCNPTCAHGP